MRALVYRDGRAQLVNDWPDPKPVRGEALVKVRMAGICRTDLEVLKGYMGFRGVMGHEFVGEIVEGPPNWKSRRAVGEINCVCGQCEMCRRGLSNHCTQRGVLGIDKHDGVFAEFVALPVDNLYVVPDSVDDVAATFVEPLAAAFQIVRQISITPHDRIVVLGAGRLGQLVARALQWHLGGLDTADAEGELLLVGKHAEKLIAAEKHHIRTQPLAEFRPGRRADVVVDATATPDGFELAMRTVRPRGTIVLKSTFAAESGLNLAPLVIDEITVVGSRCGPFQDALQALSGADGREPVDISPLVSGRYPLTEGLAALKAAAEPGQLKVLLDIHG
jgi:threonine dehydrogenase-like Zn-dependent dehydrogenase